MSYTITIDGDEAYVRHGDVVRYIPPAVLVSALTNLRERCAIDTGLLPENTRQLLRKDSVVHYIVEFPPSIQPLSFVCSGCQLRVPVALPALLFVVSLSPSLPTTLQELRVYAFDPPLHGGSPLFSPPLPNVFRNGVVCTGSMPVPRGGDFASSVRHTVGAFFASEFNGDLSERLVDFISQALPLVAGAPIAGYLNPQSPVGAYLLEHYQDSGIREFVTCLFSAEVGCLFYEAYSVDRGAAARDRIVRCLTGIRDSALEYLRLHPSPASVPARCFDISCLLALTLFLSALRACPMVGLVEVFTSYDNLVSSLA